MLIDNNHKYKKQNQGTSRSTYGTFGRKNFRTKSRVEFRPKETQNDKEKMNETDLENGDKESTDKNYKEKVDKQNIQDKSKEKQSPRKAWNVQKKIIDDIRNSAKKYAVLSEYDEEVIQDKLVFDDEEIVNKYLK